jgi:hypothetical protein
VIAIDKDLFMRAWTWFMDVRWANERKEWWSGEGRSTMFGSLAKEVYQAGGRTAKVVPSSLVHFL